MDDLKQKLHRGVKALMDTGEAASLEKAIQILSGYRLAVLTGPDVAYSSTFQAALLTIVNTGHRACLGGVTVFGCPTARLLLPLPGASSLQEAVLQWGGKLAADGEEVRSGDAPVIVIGDVDRAILCSRKFSVRVTYDGWTAGIAPVEDSIRLGEKEVFPPTGVLAGAMAVSECFQHFRGLNPNALRRTIGISLWRPEEPDPWRPVDCPRCSDLCLPEKLWLIGLGHLGQAYLWTLAMLPYLRSKEVSLVLQDFDTLCEANVSTSVLTRPEYVGDKKTRRMAQFCEQRGFCTTLVERPFDSRFTVGPDDPGLALCGVDNVAARRVLGAPGFLEVIEAGLGHAADEYLSFQLHTFPARKSPADVWQSGSVAADSDTLDRPAYRNLQERGLDACGLVQLAGCAVGAPFVGAFVAALVIAEAVRATMGVQRCEVMDGTLRDPARRVVIGRTTKTGAINLGYQRAACS